MTYGNDGTVISDEIVGDEGTLLPLHSAVGYSLTQSLFVGNRDLIVEGITDFWYLQTLSSYLNEEHEGKGLSNTVIVPAGGAQKVSYQTALMTANRLKVVVLLDDEPSSRSTAGASLVKTKMLRSESLVWASEAFDSAPKEADIEDLLPSDLYNDLVSESYSKELDIDNLQLDMNIVRIVKRYEAAFAQVGRAFHKSRPARLFLMKFAENPNIIDAASRNRFIKVFTRINDAIEKEAARKSTFGIQN